MLGSSIPLTLPERGVKQWIAPKRLVTARGGGVPGELSKSVKKQLRELAYAAHEKALRQPLADLSQHFDRWRRGEIDAIVLADLIREFNDGPSREIYRRFTWSRNDDLVRLVACGIHEGNLEGTTVPAEVKAEVDRWLAFLRSP